MTYREKAPAGAPCWVDLWTSDVEGSRVFYSELFGWHAEAPSEEFGGYFMFTRDGVPVAGGMGDMGDAAANDSWKIYLAAPDIDELVARGERGGATFMFPPEPVADLGRQTVFADPSGAVTGAWQAGSFSGFTTLDEPGTPCWFELHTADFETARDFYADVFSLRPEMLGDSPDFRYATLRSGDGAEVAGIFDASERLAEGEGSHWLVYWQVYDVAAATARVRELGGRVLEDASDSPYGVIATVADPSGARLRLRSSPAG